MIGWVYLGVLVVLLIASGVFIADLALRDDRDSWRRIAERLEAEKAELQRRLTTATTELSVAQSLTDSRAIVLGRESVRSSKEKP